MKISISEIIGHYDAVLPVDTLCVLDDTGFLPTDVSFVSPIRLKGNFINNKTYYSFVGSATATLSVACSRCLEDICYVFSFGISERFVNVSGIESIDAVKNNDDDEYGELFFFECNIIDMSEPIVTNFVLNLPSKLVCADDCKGLCITCGVNKNISECGCDKKPKNSVFDDLNNLFDNY